MPKYYDRIKGLRSIETPAHEEELASFSWHGQKMCSFFETRHDPGEVSENWKAALSVAAEQLAAIMRQQESAVRLERLEREVEELKRQIRQGQAITVPVTTLAPEPFDLARDIPVIVQPCGDEFIASFFDANINASGCNETDAVDNLKALIGAFFKRLSAMPPKKLGPGPRQQLEVLKQFLRAHN